jgi:hypothetical protein
LPVAAWWVLQFGHVLSTSATVKSAVIDRAIADRFGGRLTLGYLRFMHGLTSDYVASLAPWNYLNRSSWLPSTCASLVALALLVLAFVGAFKLARAFGASDRGERRSSPEAWAFVVTVLIVATKAVLDLVVAPLWATAWYSAPQRMVAGLIVGALACVGVRVFWSRRALRTLAIGVVLLMAVPNGLSSLASSTSARRDLRRWQDELDLAASWIDAHDHQGTYGARDAGILGFRLDPGRHVVNLDGLVNDYDYADFVKRGPSLRESIDREQVDLFVGRLTSAELKGLSCAAPVWRSPQAVRYADALSSTTGAYVYVLDVRGCRASGR